MNTPMNQHRTNLGGCVVVAVLVMLVAVLHFSGVAILHGPDADDVLVPMYFDISRAIGEHGLFAGMYDSGLVAGLSYWGSPSFHPLYPFYFNWLGSDVTIVDTLDRLKLVFFIHMAIQAAGTYLLGRTIGLRQWVAIAVGVGAPFLPAFQSVSTWPPISASLAWLPWVMLFQVRIYRQGWSPRSALGLAASVSLLIYAQPAQNLVLAFVGSAVLGLVYSAMVLRRSGRQQGLALLRPIYASLALAAAIIVVACYPYLSGVMDFHSDSIRWLGDGRDISGKDKLPLSALMAHALGGKALLAPFAFASQFTQVVGNLYVGAPLALACIAYPWVFRRRPLMMGLLASIAVSAAFCFVFVSWLLYMLPMANKVREVNWWSCYVAALALPVGALCLQRLLRLLGRVRQASRRPWHDLVLVAIPVLVLAGIVVTGEFRWQVFVAIAMATLLWVAMRVGRAFAPAVIAVVVLACVAIPFVSAERPSLGQSMILRSDRVEQRHAMAAVFAALPDSQGYRIKVSEAFNDYKVLTHQLANLGARGIRGDLNPQRRSKFELLYFPNTAVSRLYGIRYQLVPAGTEGASEVIGPYALLEDKSALPRLFLTSGGLQLVPSPAAALQGANGDQVEHVYARKRDMAGLGVDVGLLQRGAFQPTLVPTWKNTPVMIEAIVETGGAALLILNEDVEGRWYAVIDGQVQRGVPINGFQTAFAVRDAGKHSIVIRRPATLAGTLAGLPVGREP
ncbi:hypothetical protein [Stenotrophomonas sp. MMGLT7]|uniref:hypothetical protein n=1 Tax=Stenotrophomonas sp. MMGLT7 TaxID=2901227 RepID=UPI001E48F294|nr:hypothetical protein [Stenotrophomonas sp. MMGLT7]MCD7099172.1 hypothetical protein [Stenotrophomonas sp. MMGLT7]